MTDTRIQKFAQILVDHSTHVSEGDRVAITTSTAAEPLVKVIYQLVLDRGGYPHVLFDFQDQEEVFFAHAEENQLDFVPASYFQSPHFCFPFSQID